MKNKLKLVLYAFLAMSLLSSAWAEVSAEEYLGIDNNPIEGVRNIDIDKVVEEPADNPSTWSAEGLRILGFRIFSLSPFVATKEKVMYVLNPELRCVTVTVTTIFQFSDGSPCTDQQAKTLSAIRSIALNRLTRHEKAVLYQQAMQHIQNYLWVEIKLLSLYPFSIMVYRDSRAEMYILDSEYGCATVTDFQFSGGSPCTDQQAKTVSAIRYLLSRRGVELL